MKYIKYDNFCKLRREYETAEEMADVIFRSPAYIYQRLNGRHSFTYREKVALLEHIGKTAADIPEYFTIEDEKAVAV